MNLVRTTLASVTAVLLPVLAGCVMGPKFTQPRTPPTDGALLYVFRPSSPPYALKPTILINGTKAAELTSKGYFEIELRPGSYTVKADWSLPSGVPDAELPLQAAPGQSYFVVVLSEMLPWGIVSTFTSAIARVEQQAAMFDITECGEVKKYPDADRLIAPR